MIGTLSYEKTDVKINAEEVNYWKRMISSNLKIGVEIETNLDRTTDQGTAIRELRDIFSPTGSYGEFGNYGVISVKTDGSLSNGLELCTTGRRVSFIDLYNQYNIIIRNIMSYSPIMNERAGLHNHMLMDYGSNYNCLEKPFPEAVFKNFVQLLKRHMPELAYLTSTVNTVVDGNPRMTRMDRFCKADTLMKTTPLTRTVSDFKDKLMYCERYKFLNMNPMSCSENNINKFHVELRFPDGSLYPAQIAAQNVLYAAILQKAVELSELGIINCGNSELWEETKMLYDAFRNDNDNSNGNRTSSPASTEQINRIKERCKDMLLEFKAQIDAYDAHTYMILKILCETPISILRREKTDTEINDMFDAIVQNMYSTNIDDCKPIIEIINLNKINKAYSEENWNYQVGEKLNLTVQEVKNRMFKLSQIKIMKFDKELGAYTFV